MSYPFPVFGTIKDSTGALVNGGIVWLRNETTNETIFDTTGADGKYTLEAMNLASGYLTTDTFTIYCSSSNEYAESSKLFSANTHNIDLTLAVIVDSSSIYYATVQDVWDELNNKTASDISASRVVKAIQRAESMIEEQTFSAWRPVTVTDEIYDWNKRTTYRGDEQVQVVNSITRNDFFNISYNDTIVLNRMPIVSITSAYKNTAGENASDTWVALTEQTGSGGDYILYKDIGMLKMLTNIPRPGKRSLKITYVYGHSTVPRVVNRLTILLAMKDIITSRISDSMFGIQENIAVDGLSIQSANLSSGAGKYFDFMNAEIEDCWNKVGMFSSRVV